MFCICLCGNHLLWTFAARIPWKTQPWDILLRLPTAKCIASSNHNVSLEDDYCVRFFDLKFFTLTLRHMFCSPNPSNIYGQRDFVSWKNIHFCGLKKVFYFWWEIQVSSSKKYVKFLSCGYHFPSYISRLNLINLNSLFKIVTREVVSSW